jgi:phosphoheptose isomerase
MTSKTYFTQYFEKISHHICSVESAKLKECATQVRRAYEFGKKIIIVGNGSSAAMASHVEVVLPKLQGFEPSILTKQI